MTSSLKTERVNVDLGSRSYPIVIGTGLLIDIEAQIKPYVHGRKIAIITDENVANVHLNNLLSALEATDYDVTTLILPAGEQTKSFVHLQSILARLLAENFSRGDTLVAFGGGVIGDLTGFAASMLKRGCGFIQIPTTLLAQVDSSVGGKTAINTPEGKNLVGCFYQPNLVLTDLEVLKTLPPRELKAGYAEVLKYALIDDLEFFHWLEKNGTNVLSLNPKALQYVISKSCRAKAAIVKADEREQGARALLNFGHSFAHAIEGMAGYDGRVLHGEAVSAGMLMAFEYAAHLGLCAADDVRKLRAHLHTMDMPILATLPAVVRADTDVFFNYMMRDKKNNNEDLTLILSRGIGQAFVAHATDKAKVKAFIERMCVEARN